ESPPGARADHAGSDETRVRPRDCGETREAPRGTVRQRQDHRAGVAIPWIHTPSVGPKLAPAPARLDTARPLRRRGSSCEGRPVADGLDPLLTSSEEPRRALLLRLALAYQRFHDVAVGAQNHRTRAETSDQHLRLLDGHPFTDGRIVVDGHSEM